MADLNFLRQREQTEREIKLLTSLISDTLTKEETQEIEEYLDVYEFGLAFEAIVDILSEKKYRPGKDAYSLLALLGEKMHSNVADWKLVLPPLEERNLPDSEMY